MPPLLEGRGTPLGRYGFLLMRRRPPRSTLLPYTTLFRSVRHRRVPTATSSIEGDEVVTRRGAPAHSSQARTSGHHSRLHLVFRALLEPIGERRFLSSHEVPHVGRHRGDVRPHPRSCQRPD